MDTVRARPDLVIGDDEARPGMLLGSVMGLEVDDAGRIYVSDMLNVMVRVFGEGPALLAAIGRNGDGPGEYRFPSGLVFDADGILYLRDAERINLYRPRSPRDIADSATATWPIPFYSNYYSAERSRVGPDGAFYYPHYRFPIDGPPRFFYVIFRDGAVAPDTLHVPAFDNLATRRSGSIRLSENSGRMVRWASAAPFAAVPSWDVTPAGTILGSTASPRRSARAGCPKRCPRSSPCTSRKMESSGSDAGTPRRDRRPSMSSTRTASTWAP